ncbi:MAG: TIGR03435 family protein [Candidatus Solibacter sp.]
MRHTSRFALFLGTLAAFAQDAPLPEFEVASIKVAPAIEGQMAEAKMRAMDGMVDMMVGMVPMKGMTVTMDSRTLQQLIATAYKVRVSEVAGPSWISDLRFNVEAKLPAGADKKSANEMLQRLLEQRFGLKFHREARTVSGFVLSLGKDGAHLTAAAPPDPVAATPDPNAKVDPEEGKRRMEKMMADMKQRGSMPASWWRSNNATSAQIASNVSRMIKAPVSDETKLDGKYDVTLEVPQPESPEDSMEYRVARAVTKLGLKLDARKISIDTIVVDAASKTPTEN